MKSSFLENRGNRKGNADKESFLPGRAGVNLRETAGVAQGARAV